MKAELHFLTPEELKLYYKQAVAQVEFRLNLDKSGLSEIKQLTEFQSDLSMLSKVLTNPRASKNTYLHVLQFIHLVDNSILPFPAKKTLFNEGLINPDGQLTQVSGWPLYKRLYNIKVA